MGWLAIGDGIRCRSWVEIKGTHIARNVIHDIRFQRHLHVDRPDDVTQFPFVDFQHPFDVRRVACPAPQSIARSRWLWVERTNLRHPPTWLWLSSRRMTVITGVSCSRCWNTGACMSSSHHRSRRTEYPPAALPHRLGAVRMSDVPCIRIVTSKNAKGRRIHLPIHRGGREQSRRVTSRVSTGQRNSTSTIIDQRFH